MGCVRLDILNQHYKSSEHKVFIAVNNLSSKKTKRKERSVNLYNYCANNPINRIDPDGQDWIISTTKNKDGSETVNITLNIAVLNSSSNSNIDMSAFASSLSKQVQKSYGVSYSRNEIVGYGTVGGGLDGIPATKIPIYKDVKVDVLVNVNARPITSKEALASNEHLVQIQDASKLPGVYGKADGIGSKTVFINEKFVANIINGNDNNTLPHELGHTLGLRHIDQKYESFFEVYLWGSNPQYMNPSMQKANANNAMFSGGSSYMNDKTSTEINGLQIEQAKKNYQNGTINRQ